MFFLMVFKVRLTVWVGEAIGEVGECGCCELLAFCELFCEACWCLCFLFFFDGVESAEE